MLVLATFTNVQLKNVAPVTAAIVIWTVCYRSAPRLAEPAGAPDRGDPVHPDPPLRAAREPALPDGAVPLLVLLIVPAGSHRCSPTRGCGGAGPASRARWCCWSSRSSARCSRIPTACSRSRQMRSSSSRSSLVPPVLYLIVSVVRREATIDFLVKMLVGGGAIVGAPDHRRGAHALQPLRPPHAHHADAARASEAYVGQDGRGDRAYASAQHPISLGAALVMLIPLAFYLARGRRQRRWWVAARPARARLPRDLLADERAHARRGLVVYVMLRPLEVKKVWPLPVPAARRHPLDGSRDDRNVQERRSSPPVGSSRSSRRRGHARQREARRPRPGLERVVAPAALRRGLRNARGRTAPSANALILDDQWLGTLLETGAVGRDRLALAVRARRRPARPRWRRRTTRRGAGCGRARRRRSRPSPPGCSPTTRSRSSR